MPFTNPQIISPIKPFSSATSYDFPFIYSSGDQAVRNNLVIERLSDGVTVYNQTIESFSLKHQVPINTLVNGTNLRAKIRVGNINNQWSQFSDWVIFWVLAPPSLTIDNIDYANQNRVYNQTVSFSSTYTHPTELLQSFRYILYDSNQNLIQSYPEQFANGSTPLTQEVTGLVNGDLYYIELKTISVNLQEFTTGKILVRPFYIAPKFTNAINVENVSDEGAIKVSSTIVQIFGKLYDNNGTEILPANIQYVSNEKIDLNRVDYGKVTFQQGFKIEGNDFVLKLWCANITDDTVFLTLYSNYGRIDLTKYNNRIHAFKYISNITKPSHFASNEFTLATGQQFMIYMKSESNLIDLSVTTI